MTISEHHGKFRGVVMLVVMTDDTCRQCCILSSPSTRIIDFALPVCAYKYIK